VNQCTHIVGLQDTNSTEVHGTNVDVLRAACHVTQICRNNKPDRCRGKFFPPPYCHNVTNANANPNPNPNRNTNFNPILNLNPNPYCCVWE